MKLGELASRCPRMGKKSQRRGLQMGMTAAFAVDILPALLTAKGLTRDYEDEDDDA